ncbi:LysR family transcriptional regulator [Pseudoalteromonas rubra]|uniref:LysR family transcriptional regulator n=1 Tax=Pseudoalteromonas rubra TaxID=43658 RepID=A0A5S3WKX7_9GAMM|nr:LysR family transcriptional regulator [Pseudoalteromonas rubra]TMP28277.1 LysR family transcriptional regulator [Pseudoalteromonas rubra]TMP34876.1 LysR family transcriptional regulator [Pseudoalteromonas rubra]
MNIDHLKLFVRTASTHNISQAGSDLGLSAAVASSHINKLETELGVRLLHRTTRKVALTEEGLAFLPHAEDVLNGVEAARAAIGAGTTKPSGTLRLTMPASFGRMHVLPALPGFFALYPDIKLDLKLSDTIADLVEGGFDLAIRNSALKDSTLVAKRLATDTRLLTAAPDYLALEGEPQSPEDLRDHACITLSGLEHWSFQTPDGIQTIKVQGQLRADNGDAIREACQLGLGITINSRWSAYQALHSEELVEVLPDYPLKSDTAIWLVYPSSRLLAPKVRVFIDYLTSYFGDIPYWEK